MLQPARRAYTESKRPCAGQEAGSRPGRLEVRKQAKLVVISDVDGCVVDRVTYSHAVADATIDRLKQAGVPLVLCSSQTRAEMERIREQLGLTDPFISENGGAIFSPVGAFPFVPPGAVLKGAYDVVELGRPHRQVLQVLIATAARVGVDITTFSDMSVQRVATECGLALAEARLAKLREYDEPFRLVDEDPAVRAKLCRSLRAAGLRCAHGGRYDHVTLATDKGVAVGVLRRFYQRAWGEVTTVGLGDGLHDVELLRAVDVPIVVRSPDERVTAELAAAVRRSRTTALDGPAGWSEAVMGILERTDQREPAGGGGFLSFRGRRSRAAGPSG
jgi:mannosyl-3-phosphoglycerate phosphatase